MNRNRQLLYPTLEEALADTGPLRVHKYCVSLSLRLRLRHAASFKTTALHHQNLVHHYI